MNKSLMIKLFDWPKPYITGVDLRQILGKSDDSRQALVKRAVQEGFLIRLRNDFFLIQPHLKREVVDAFEIAPILYGPSYISKESALQHHGWIPEAVAATTAATSNRSKQIETPIGLFSYCHVPVPAFHMGVSQSKLRMIADPWKAIADLIYTQKRSWSSLKSFCEDMRIESDIIQTSDQGLLVYLSDHYPSQRVKKTLKRLI